MLNEVKTALRVSHNALDSEFNDLIDEARHDLMLSGISSIKATDDTDPLIKRAIKLYCKANSSDKDTEKYQMSYDSLKNHLTLAGDYRA